MFCFIPVESLFYLWFQPVEIKKMNSKKLQVFIKFVFSVKSYCSRWFQPVSNPKNISKTSIKHFLLFQITITFLFCWCYVKASKTIRYRSKLLFSSWLISPISLFMWSFSCLLSLSLRLSSMIILALTYAHTLSLTNTPTCHTLLSLSLSFFASQSLST